LAGLLHLMAWLWHGIDVVARHGFGSGRDLAWHGFDIAWHGFGMGQHGLGSGFGMAWLWQALAGHGRAEPDMVLLQASALA
jgi:hypothetical protein